MQRIKKGIPLLLILMISMFLFPAAAENSHPLQGEWAFPYEPEKTVLTVREDGNAVLQGKEYRWQEDEPGFLKMTDAEDHTLLLRYSAADEKTVIYLQTSYHRGEEKEGQGGLIGIWEGENDGSSFVFTPMGYFLEDSVFSGNFMADPEKGTFLLHYGDVFADTVCYYSIENEILTVEYPWEIIRPQSAEESGGEGSGGQ